MSFNSLPFVFLFLPACVAGYFLLQRVAPRGWTKAWLILASLFFYSAGQIENLPILVGSVSANCLLARYLLNPSRFPWLSPRILLFAGILSNIVFLCYFKYAGFFVQIINQVGGANFNIPIASFPLGISFFTIQQIMFLVDCYEGLIEGHGWLDYVLFATFFPSVTMGPIVRWKNVVPQVNDPQRWRPNPDNMATGLYVFFIGLFKKVVLADSFFRWADAGFGYHSSLSLLGAWIAAVSFTFELYFDFSGYTDMAIGAALMLNIKLPQNFNGPFRSKSISEFWRRWHITLTNFITTYLYTPMIRAMGRITFVKAMVATTAAMLIAGFWHGANWTFIVFGGLHGVALVLNQVWKKLRWPMPGKLGWLLTFTFVVISLVFFRSPDMTHACHIIGAMCSLKGGLFSYEPWTGIDRVDQVLGIAWMLIGTTIVSRAPSSMKLEQTFKPSWATVALTIGLASVACFYANGVVSRSFVYREF